MYLLVVLSDGRLRNVVQGKQHARERPHIKRAGLSAAEIEAEKLHGSNFSALVCSSRSGETRYNFPHPRREGQTRRPGVLHYVYPLANVLLRNTRPIQLQRTARP